MKIEYFAGLFDGEGSISLVKNNMRGYYYRRPSIQLSMCHKGIIYDIKRSFGGHVYRQKRKTKSGFTVWKWMCCDKKNCTLILCWLRHYLVVKRPQAEKVYKWLKK